MSLPARGVWIEIEKTTDACLLYTSDAADEMECVTPREGSVD